MTNEKMTIHKALAELKIIDDRIRTAINTTVYIKAVKHSAKKINGMTIPEFSESITSGYKRVNDLINRRNAIKRAVVLSNATTTVTINGVEYTVAEAIEMKNHGMDFLKILLNTMTRSNRMEMTELENHSGEKMEYNAQNYILNVLGTQNSKDSRIDSDEMKKLREVYIENNTYDLIDPLKIKSKMQELDDKINNFMTEVDAALSVSNALTVIEINY